VATAIVSDLHLGTAMEADVARRPEPLERLADALGRADRVVILGDLLELRERPAAAVLEDVAPVLRRLGEAAAGKPVVVLPGNHDHQLVAPALERARLAGRAPDLASAYEPAPGDLGHRLAELMPKADVTFSYPGAWLRDDVYATHGHYLDVHMSVPRVESLIAATVQRYGTRIGGAGPRSPSQYESIFGPLYALGHALAQNAQARPHVRRNSVSRTVWRAATGHGGSSRLTRALVGRAAIPGAVAGIKLIGLRQFRADISAGELRRAGLRAMAEVVDRLQVDAEHVIFGHTHRAGPLDGEAAEWRTATGVQLFNTGSWIDEIFADGAGSANPYWPGRVTWLDETGPPRFENVLDD
jgi:UDP-2,3-diacylglucosamine pyrophosphatase LpxH